MKNYFVAPLLIKAWLIAACLFALTPAGVDSKAFAGSSIPAESSPRLIEIPLCGPCADPRAEISGMDWLDDRRLILLPQYPQYFSKNRRSDIGSLFVADKKHVSGFISGHMKGDLEPQPLSISFNGLVEKVEAYESGCKFEGFEAIVFEGDCVWLTIEARSRKKALGFLVSGKMNADLSAMAIDPETLVEIPSPVQVPNMAYEALVKDNGRVLAVHEANGVNLTSRPRAYGFKIGMCGLPPKIEGALSFPTIEYRITDATALDQANRFYAINYFYPGGARKLKLPYTPKHPVEQLVEFQVTEKGVEKTHSPAVNLRTDDDAPPNNWEALVRLDDRGFLIMTDKFPRTRLVFAPRTK